MVSLTITNRLRNHSNRDWSMTLIKLQSGCSHRRAEEEEQVQRRSGVECVCLLSMTPLPRVGSTSPVMSLSSVDLPAPLGPTT